jgi:hypothetical protein
MGQKIAKDTPLAEITLRKYERPETLESRELVRKLCLSLGLLQPGDSRDIIVDIVYVILTSKKELTSVEVEVGVIEKRKALGLALVGVASSNIRRQLLRLRDLFLVEKVKNNYRIRENSKLFVIFKESIEKYMLSSILLRVEEYVKEIDKRISEEKL